MTAAHSTVSHLLYYYSNRKKYDKRDFASAPAFKHVIFYQSTRRPLTPATYPWVISTLMQLSYLTTSMHLSFGQPKNDNSGLPGHQSVKTQFWLQLQVETGNTSMILPLTTVLMRCLFYLSEPALSGLWKTIQKSHDTAKKQAATEQTNSNKR